MLKQLSLKQIDYIFLTELEMMSRNSMTLQALMCNLFIEITIKEKSLT